MATPTLVIPFATRNSQLTPEDKALLEFVGAYVLDPAFRQEVLNAGNTTMIQLQAFANIPKDHDIHRCLENVAARLREATQLASDGTPQALNLQALLGAIRGGEATIHDPRCCGGQICR